MGKRSKNTLNLRDNKSMMELMKKLYGIGEAKDGQEICNPIGETGAEGIGEVAGLPSDTSGILLQEQ